MRRHRRRRGILATTLVLVGTLHLAPARADVVTLADRTLRLTPTQGFCALDRTDGREDQIFSLSQTMIGPQNRLLAYWVPCAVLDLYRGQQADQLAPYVMIMAQLQGGDVVPVDLPRADFLAGLDQYLAKSHGGQDAVAANDAEIRRRFDDTAGQLGRAKKLDLALGEMRIIGLLAREDIARYVGIIVNLSRAGEPTPIAGVLGFTEVRGLSITVNVYDVYVDQKTFDRLQALAHQFIVDILTDNNDLTQDTAPRPSRRAGYKGETGNFVPASGQP